MKPYKQRRLFLVTDENVYFYYKNHLKEVFSDYDVSYTIIKAGETSKSLENYYQVCNELLSKHIQRKDMIIAFGGGVVGDLTGFVAATILRGVDFIQIPTTLLAMVDSSIGSKVGINTSYGKNLLGAFKHPILVIIDPWYLKTLPKAQYNNGMAEVIKACLIKDETLIFDLKNNHIENIITKAISVKKDIVLNDPYEHNERLFLNFGHTFGHAIEKASNYQINHGYAIAMGMDIAVRLGIYLNITNKEVLKTLHELLNLYNLPSYNSNLLELLPYISQDKKSTGDFINFVFIKDVGKPLIKKIAKEAFYEISSI